MSKPSLLKFFLVGVVILFLFFPFTVIQAALPPPPNIKVSIGDAGGSAIFKAIEEVDCDSASGKCYQIGWIGQYISALYQYGVGLAAVLAVVMIMAGGFIWLTAAGNPSQVGKAKEFISSALLGLFLALFSFVILNALNPRLVNLEPLEVQKVSKVASQCCGFREPSGVVQYSTQYGDDVKGCSSLGEGWEDASVDNCTGLAINGCCICPSSTFGFVGFQCFSSSPAACPKNPTGIGGGGKNCDFVSSDCTAPALADRCSGQNIQEGSCCVCDDFGPFGPYTSCYNISSEQAYQCGGGLDSRMGGRGCKVDPSLCAALRKCVGNIK